MQRTEKRGLGGLFRVFGGVLTAWNWATETFYFGQTGKGFDWMKVSGYQGKWGLL